MIFISKNFKTRSLTKSIFSLSLSLQIPEYLEKEWSCRYEIQSEPLEFAVWTFNSYDSASKMSLDLGMHTLNKNGSLVMSLYCPFWMLNKTGVMLAYRVSKYF